MLAPGTIVSQIFRNQGTNDSPSVTTQNMVDQLTFDHTGKGFIINADWYMPATENSKSMSYITGVTYRSG